MSRWVLSREGRFLKWIRDLGDKIRTGLHTSEKLLLDRISLLASGCTTYFIK